MGCCIGENSFAFGAETMFDANTFEPISSNNNTSVCPYCGRKISHSNRGPNVLIYEIKNELWQPKLVTKYHDIRQEYKCDGCGAPFMLQTQQREITVTGNIPSFPPPPPKSRKLFCL